MIRVKRSEAPAVLRESGAAARERKRAKEFYDDPANAGKTFKFKVYSSDEVKLALERLFHSKCAYCESRYAATQPMDVEHWRPKAEVLEHDGTVAQGYPWAASDWDNLLPSCIDCNRERRQLLVDVGKVANAGKGTRFPIAKTSKRALSREELSAEVPLLLHPCEDEPEQHFGFTDEAVIRPRLSGADQAARAIASIEVYALNRSGLVDERLHLLRLMQQRMYTIQVLIDVFDRATGNDAILLEDLIAHEMTELRAFADPKRPYSAMARYFVNDFAARLQS